jgi:uncharacterized protein (TIGR02466 family)
MIKDYFSTPVGFYQCNLTTSVIEDFMRASQSEFYNLWTDMKLTPDMSRVKQEIEGKCRDYVSPHFSTYMSSARPVNIEGKINVQYPGNMFPLHSHSHCHVASILYLVTPENCGDLLLVDPRGDNNWTERVDGNYSNLSYERITPKEGLLVFFPGYISHMVEPNKSDKVRVSVVTNFYLSRK